MNNMLKAAICVLLLLPMVSTEIAAQSLTIKIEREHSSIQGRETDISISLSGPHLPLRAFHFLIAYDPRMLTYLGCAPGGLTASVSGLQIDCQPLLLEGMEGDSSVAFIKIEGHGDSTNAALQHRDSSGVPDSLVDLKFKVTRERRWASLFSPIRFAWSSSDDNLLWFAGAESPANCIIVRDHDSWIYDGDTTGLITGIDCTTGSRVRYGGPCESSDGDTSGPRAVFWNGGAYCSEYDGWFGPNRGDIDANGYICQEQDLALLAKYFIRGDRVFDFIYEVQAGGSDANLDNLNLTVADLVYMELVVSDQLQPPSEYRQCNWDMTFVKDQLRLKPWLTFTDGMLRLRGSVLDTVTMSWRDGLLSGEADTTLGAVWALFDVPDSSIVDSVHCLQDMSLDCKYVDGELRVLLWAELDSLRRHVEAGKQPLFEVPQNATLKYLQAGDYTGNVLKVLCDVGDSTIAFPLTLEEL